MKRSSILIYILIFIILIIAAYYVAHLWNNYTKTSPVVIPGITDIKPGVTQPTVTKNCIKAGGVYQGPAVLGKIQGDCCDGLNYINEVHVPLTGNINCKELAVAGGNLICSACGNGKCESGWENKCNCPEDCETNCHKAGKVFSTMPLPTGGQDIQPCCGILKIIEGIDVAVCANCGNKVCDSFESGLKEDKSTCPEDCK
jgi:hypothetical protein